MGPRTAFGDPSSESAEEGKGRFIWKCAQGEGLTKDAGQFQGGLQDDDLLN